jgi:acetylornithine deacetylase/succinyl-diaminopimelate desuccinylase-like protein
MDLVRELIEYVKHPSVSTDPAFKVGMTGAREHICGLLKQAGLEIEVIATPLHPIVLARRRGPAEWPHIVLYGHYDVQPADPLNLWTTPAFEPVVRDGRIWGRGTADNKGPHLVAVVALAQLLKRRPDLPLRITFLIEGEEEIGSPSFPEFLHNHKKELAEADCVVLSDTASPSTDQIVITTGLRGIVGLEVGLTGPRSDLHSGLHGGAVYNPIQALAELCASLHDADNAVTVEGFYDGVEQPTGWEREELRKLPLTEEAYRRFLDVEALHPAPGLDGLEAVRFAPTLEFNGIGGGYQGKGSKTVIPSKVFAKITCRLVPGQDPVVVHRKVAEAIHARAPKGVRVEIKEMQGNAAYYVCPPDRPNTPKEQNPVLARAFREADKAIAQAFGKAPLYLREGGSVPIIGDIRRETGLDSVMIGLFTPDSNLHAPDENFELGMAEKAVKAYELLLERVAGTPRR